MTEKIWFREKNGVTSTDDLYTTQKIDHSVLFCNRLKIITNVNAPFSTKLGIGFHTS